MIRKIGLGGGCHWCTEAVFLSLKGVVQVEQGWIASQPPHDALSEAVIVMFDPAAIGLADLIEIHLHTHSSASQHAMRNKYRSAVYYFDIRDEAESKRIITNLQDEFEKPLVTQVLPFACFKASLPEYRDYFYSNPGKPFCTTYIYPKLKMLRDKFSRFANEESNSIKKAATMQHSIVAENDKAGIAKIK